VRYWPPTNSFLLLGVLNLCQFWCKSIKKCDCESACRRTDRQTQTNFIICPMLYAIAIGQIKMMATTASNWTQKNSVWNLFKMWPLLTKRQKTLSRKRNFQQRANIGLGVSSFWCSKCPCSIARTWLPLFDYPVDCLVIRERERERERERCLRSTRRVLECMDGVTTALQYQCHVLIPPIRLICDGCTSWSPVSSDAQYR